MKLYQFPPAPNAARVLFYLKEKGIDDVELVVVNFLTGEHRAQEHLARSPRGTVPVLELEDGTYLRESVAIIEYLEERFPQPPMIGSDAVQRAQTRAVERYIEINVMMRLVRLVHSTKSPIGLPAKPALADNERAMLPSPLAYVDELIGEGPFVMGERVSIADCTLLAGLNFAQFGAIELDDLSPDVECANIKRWYERFALRHL